MAKLTWLQKRVGGHLGSQSSRLVASGRKALEKLEPEVRRALDDNRACLATIVAAPAIDTDALYELTHDLRGLAGTFGYASLGLIADAIGRYICACQATDMTAHESALRVLTQALDQAFVKDDEGGEALSDLTAGALALVRAKIPAAA
jgi:chemotaxis protein histidine kinase CheA